MTTAGILPAILAALAIAALSTLGDYVWAAHPPTQKTVAGLVHGAVLCLGIGMAVGAPRRRPLLGALGGMAIGTGAAASFYVLVRALGYAAMFVSWMALWCGFGVLCGRALGAQWSWRESLVRGFLAALGSGLAFYAVSGIWMPFDPARRGYAYHFACWTIAFLPGFLALLAGRAPKTGEARP
jgi:hypothetical protein